MEYFPFIHEKPKPKNDPIPLYKEVDDPYQIPPRKEQEENQENPYIIIIQL